MRFQDAYIIGFGLGTIVGLVVGNLSNNFFNTFLGLVFGSCMLWVGMMISEANEGKAV